MPEHTPMDKIRLRPAQQKILQYQGGQMGIAAVPGAGKTFTLSMLAAKIITEGWLDEGQEVLIVTLTNSAVDTFTARIRARLEERGLIGTLGYRVRTLHGLAHDIVREKPALAGLDEHFGIADERTTAAILREAARAQYLSQSAVIDAYLRDDLDEKDLRRIREKNLPNLLEKIAQAFIRTAKDRRLTPTMLSQRLQAHGARLPLAAFGLNIYASYQRGLRARGMVDFDDLMRLALDILEQDPDYLARLQERWPFILEDEAQDSSRLQEDILRLLASQYGNWVRVGDPNQAIYETFTTANPQFLRDFIKDPNTRAKPLPQSGRSQEWIIRLANQLVAWTMREHPAAAVRDALSAPPWIQPVPPDDPQANPPADPSAIHLVGKVYTPEGEIKQIIRSLKNWLPSHPEQTAAILVPSNKRGKDFVEALQHAQLPYMELLNSTDQTRRTAGTLTKVLRYLARPDSAPKLASAYEAVRRDWREDKAQKAFLKTVREVLRRCPSVEAYLAPRPDDDWLETLRDDQPPEVLQELEDFRRIMQRWQSVILLPIDQIIITLGQELFTQPSELALTHKMALVLKQFQQENPSYRLPEFVSELTQIARNERKFLGFSEADTGFNPDAYPGQVLVTTAHRAKGLEWDRVYLTSVNTYDYPSLEEGEYYIFEDWYIRDALNLPAETLAQLRLLWQPSLYDAYQEGAASQSARLDYIRERLRLLYVGITRARRELIITANSGRHGKNTAALPLRMLIEWWQKQGDAPDEPA